MNKPCCRSCSAPQKYQSLKAPYVFGGTPAHSFWECEQCGLIYLNPVLSQEDEAKFYAQEFEKFMDARAGSDRNWSGPEEHVQTNQDQVIRRSKFLESSLGPGIDVLEFGCSSGFMLDYFRGQGANTVGIEPSGGFSDFLSMKKHTVFRNIDELELEKPGIKFDLITHFFVLEHIDNTRSFLKKQLDLLKPKGKIIFEIPCALDPLTALYDIPEFEKFYWSIAHHYYFTPKSLAFILDDLECDYELIPEQRYDLSNHLTWAADGVPGGQNRYKDVFSSKLIDKYKRELMEANFYDTLFVEMQNKMVP